MTDFTGAVASQAALTQQTLAITAIRLANEQAQSLVSLIAGAADSSANLSSPAFSGADLSVQIPVSENTGANIDISV